MSTSTPQDILLQFKKGTLSLEEASQQLQESQCTHLGHTRIDKQRALRTGVAEVIYGEGKTLEQLHDIIHHLHQEKSNILVTRLNKDAATSLMGQFPSAQYNPVSRLLTLINIPPSIDQSRFIAVITAGTSDHAIAEEAAQTAEFLGNRVERFFDCGVAGLHRLLAVIEPLREARVLIAVAGMEGALPSVLAGLVKNPVIAVPTSVGYGANFEGISTLLAMINSCANGISIVNINNGFGAGYNAHIINNL